MQASFSPMEQTAESVSPDALHRMASELLNPSAEQKKETRHPKLTITR
jgi:hypothetical protein